MTPNRTDDFVRRALKRHNNKYDYSESEFVNTKTKVKIICKNHGSFWQRPDSHWGGAGCPRCANKLKSRSKRSHTSDFVAKARKIHNDRYSYEEVDYHSSSEKVAIRCYEHGLFFQRPNDHLTGKGCRECAISQRASLRRKSTKQFVFDAKKVHGSRFSYEKTVYAGDAKELTITCPLHGDFTQKAGKHLAGQITCLGCRMIVTDTASFIQAARGVHGDFYDYSKSVFVRSLEPVTIVCPEHGAFQQSPNKHQTGRGCALCANKRRNDGVRSLAALNFIGKAQKIHGDRYDYSYALYVSNDVKIKIGCPDHGLFEQTPGVHLSGAGCIVCGRLSQSEKRRRPLQEFIDLAREIHGDRYDYSQANYTQANAHITIICQKHGSFEQTPSAHLNAQTGCPYCAETGFQPAKPAIVYYLRVVSSAATFYKIGITNRSVEERFPSPKDRKKITVLQTIPFDWGADAMRREQDILLKYKQYSYKGEPILSSGNTELFVRDVLGVDHAQK